MFSASQNIKPTSMWPSAGLAENEIVWFISSQAVQLASRLSVKMVSPHKVVLDAAEKQMNNGVWGEKDYVVTPVGIKFEEYVK